MNLYVTLCSGLNSKEAAALGPRLAAWHDAMVAHERRLRTDNRPDDLCDDECPHAEAPRLWAEAVSTLGGRADELTFLRSRANERFAGAHEHRPRGEADLQVGPGTAAELHEHSLWR